MTDTPLLQLDPMTTPDRDAFMRAQTEEYTAALTEGYALTPEQAAAQVAKLREGLDLDDERETFFHLRDGASRVGRLWLSRPDPLILFVSQLEIAAAHRGRGLGRRAMAAIEAHARELGATRVALHVFAHNTVARRLYEGAGFRTGGLNMFRSVD